MKCKSYASIIFAQLEQYQNVRLLDANYWGKVIPSEDIVLNEPMRVTCTRYHCREMWHYPNAILMVKTSRRFVMLFQFKL